MKSDENINSNEKEKTLRRERERENEDWCIWKNREKVKSNYYSLSLLVLFVYDGSLLVYLTHRWQVFFAL